MKKNILLPASVVLLSIAFASCSDSTTPNNTAGKTNPDSSTAGRDTAVTKQTAAVYTCKMHPEVTSDKPGKCPKCGMDLVKKEDLEPKENPAKDSIMQGMKRNGSMKNMKMDKSMKGMKMDTVKH